MNSHALARKAQRRLLACVVLVLGASGLLVNGHLQAQAPRTLYVSSTGNDANAGTATAPFRTIQRAADLVDPGDTVIVENGVYTGNGSGCGSGGRAMVCVTRGGSSSALVTFKARNRWGAKLDGQNNTRTEGFHLSSSANWVRIDGFEIYGMGNATGSASGVDMYDGGRDSIVTQNNIHDIGHLCTGTNNGQVGIFIQQPRVTVTRNLIHDIGRFDIGEAGCSVGHNKAGDHGVYVNGTNESASIPGADDSLITSNIFYSVTDGWAVQMYPGDLSRVSVLNNTFAFPNTGQDGHIVLDAVMNDVRIMNNIFYKPRGAAIRHNGGTQTNLRVTNNIVYDVTTMISPATPSGTTLASNQIPVDPLLVNPATAPYDFHLKPGSPAIGVGLTLTEVPVDFDGLVRVAPYAIGAYELSSGKIPPSPPTGLRVIR